MPKKIDLDRTHGEKLIGLFSRLLFSNRSYSLTELSSLLNCSKQTIQRLVDNINASYSVIIHEEIIGRHKFYSIEKLPNMPHLSLTVGEYRTLLMCQAFTQHLLGRKLFDEANRALEKSSALIAQPVKSSADHFAVIRPGSIDYTPYQEMIRTIIEAMEQKRICKIVYHSIGQTRAKTFYIKAFKLFSHHETLYLHARKARSPGRKYKAPDYDPLLAVHRLIKVELTDRNYEFPGDYDFEKFFNQEFGVMKDDVFKVEVEFTGFSALYVAERLWSADQKIVKKKDGGIKLTFSASSTPEILSWVFSFNEEAKVVKPAWLKEKVVELINGMQSNYS